MSPTHENVVRLLHNLVAQDSEVRADSGRLMRSNLIGNEWWGAALKKELKNPSPLLQAAAAELLFMRESRPSEETKSVVRNALDNKDPRIVSLGISAVRIRYQHPYFDKEAVRKVLVLANHKEKSAIMDEAEQAVLELKRHSAIIDFIKATEREIKPPVLSK